MKKAMLILRKQRIRRCAARCCLPANKIWIKKGPIFFDLRVEVSPAARSMGFEPLTVLLTILKKTNGPDGI